MLFPIGDNNADRKITPVVNYTLIAINIAVFVLLQKLGMNDSFTYAYCTVPAEILTGKDIVANGQNIFHEVIGHKHNLPNLMPTPIPVYLTLLSSTFLHGGLAHLLGNMLYLWIFGDNIENRLGSGRYLLFYLGTGIIASLCHVFSVYFQGGNPYIPCVGASGAISAVMGAYIYLFPRNSVTVLLGIFPMRVPAFIALGAWIGFQILNGLGIIGSSNGGGVAYAAHIGGFIAGFILIGMLDKEKFKR
jgi:membrane associated rhomboid family serine protease